MQDLIEKLENRVKKWQLIAGGLGLVVVGLLMLAAWQSIKLLEVKEELTEARAELSKLKATTKPSTGSDHRLPLEKAMSVALQEAFWKIAPKDTLVTGHAWDSPITFTVVSQPLGVGTTTINEGILVTFPDEVRRNFRDTFAASGTPGPEKILYVICQRNFSVCPDEK